MWLENSPKNMTFNKILPLKVLFQHRLQHCHLQLDLGLVSKEKLHKGTPQDFTE